MSSRYRYRTGWCGTDRHGRCAGTYAGGIVCTCQCHQPPNDRAQPDSVPTLF